MTEYTKGPWSIDWYVCTADANDVAYANEKGKRLSIGDELWRMARSIGPVSVDNNHWAGWHLDVSEEDARLISAAPDMLELLEESESILTMTGFRLYEDMIMRMRAAIAKAKGQ